MARIPMPSPLGTNLAHLFLPWPSNPVAAYDAAPKGVNMTNQGRFRRMAQDQLNADDALALVRILLSGLPSEESAAFRDQLADMLNGNGEPEPQPNGDTPPSFRGMPRPGGGQDRRYAQDRRGGSFAERFPNAARVQGSASPRSRTW
jgi:hypothetical protein